jgi:YbgC/YbaW family acyl-CoA thioester hydrolase
LLREWPRPRIQATAVHEMRFRAWPWSCDLNLHVNNAQYLYFMEFGRWAFTLRCGLLRRVVRHKVQLLVAGVSVLYRRPIRLLRSFTVRTRVVAADARWFYFVQELHDHQGQLATRALLRATARDRRGVVSAAQAFGESSFASPDSTDELKAFAALTREHLAPTLAGSALERPTDGA